MTIASEVLVEAQRIASRSTRGRPAIVSSEVRAIAECIVRRYAAGLLPPAPDRRGQGVLVAPPNAVAARYTRASTIRKLTSHNPYERGSKEHEAWGKVRAGQTVGALTERLGQYPRGLNFVNRFRRDGHLALDG